MYKPVLVGVFICCWSKYLSCRRARRTARTVDEIRPINSVKSKTVALEWERRFWHFKITCSIFCSVSDKVMVGVSISRPKNSICWDGLTTNFFIFFTKSRCRSGKINVCLLIKIYSNVFPIRKILPRYVSRWMLICLNRVIDTFKSFENILGAAPNPKQSQKNSHLSSTVVLTNRYLLDISCRDHYFPREGISSNANLQFWNPFTQ